MKAIVIAVLWSTAVSSYGQIAATVLLQGIILDALSRKPISATLTFFDVNGKKINETRSNAAEGGVYQCILKPGMRYSVQLRSEGFMVTTDTLSLPATNRYTELSHDFVLLPKIVGQRFIVSIPLFELNSSRMRVGAEEELTNYLQLLKDNPEVQITIECYPDRNDSAIAIRQLTQQRAQAISEFFSKRGITPSRLSIAPTTTTDPFNPPPRKLRPKGRFYFGGTYFVIRQVQ